MVKYYVCTVIVSAMLDRLIQIITMWIVFQVWLVHFELEICMLCRLILFVHCLEVSPLCSVGFPPSKCAEDCIFRVVDISWLFWCWAVFQYLTLQAVSCQILITLGCDLLNAVRYYLMLLNVLKNSACYKREHWQILYTSGMFYSNKVVL